MLTCHRLHVDCKFCEVGWATPGHRRTPNARQEKNQLSKAKEKEKKNELKSSALIVEKSAHLLLPTHT